MRRIILYMFTSLDGFIAGPDGEFDDYEPSDEEMRFANELFGSADGILFGRVTFGEFVEYWDGLDLSDESVAHLEREFAVAFRGMSRVVISRTLAGAPEGALLIREGDIGAEVQRLKRQPGRDFVLICGPELLGALVELELVDEFIILVKPRVMGRGKALFGRLPDRLDLRLLSTRVFESGVVLHRYQPLYRDVAESGRQG